MRWKVQPEWSESEIAKTGVLPKSLVKVLDEGLKSIGSSFVIGSKVIHIMFTDNLGWLSNRTLHARARRLARRLGMAFSSGTRVWVHLDTIRVRPGEWMSAGGELDLSGPFGMARLGHEVIHCLQYAERGWLRTMLYLWLPWVTGRAAKDIAWEREAADIELRLRKWAVS